MTYILLITAVVMAFGFVHFRVRFKRRAQIGKYAFPPGVRKKFSEAHPDLTLEQADQIFEGLRQWFTVCSLAGKRFLAMPSQAVDDAWHTFIWVTRHYDMYCHKAFRRFLHHTPGEAMVGQTTPSDGIKQGWRLACKLENIDPKNPTRLPTMFAMDAMLGIAGGSFYELISSPVAIPTAPAVSDAAVTVAAVAVATAAAATVAVATVRCLSGRLHGLFARALH